MKNLARKKKETGIKIVAFAIGTVHREHPHPIYSKRCVCPYHIHGFVKTIHMHTFTSLIWSISIMQICCTLTIACFFNPPAATLSAAVWLAVPRSTVKRTFCKGRFFAQQSATLAADTKWEFLINPSSYCIPCLNLKSSEITKSRAPWYVTDCDTVKVIYCRNKVFVHLIVQLRLFSYVISYVISCCSHCSLLGK